jgi:hypothetical protein
MVKISSSTRREKSPEKEQTMKRILRIGEHVKVQVEG